MWGMDSWESPRIVGWNDGGLGAGGQAIVEEEIQQVEVNFGDASVFGGDEEVCWVVCDEQGPRGKRSSLKAENVTETETGKAGKLEEVSGGDGTQAEDGSVAGG